MELAGPAAEASGYNLTSGMLNVWISNGRLLNQLRGYLGKRRATLNSKRGKQLSPLTAEIIAALLNSSVEQIAARRDGVAAYQIRLRICDRRHFDSSSSRRAR